MAEESNTSESKSKVETAHYSINEIPPKNAPQKVLVEWCVKSILDMKVRTDKLEQNLKDIPKIKPTKSSASSPALWIFAILVLVIIGYLIFMVYAQSKGYNIRIPSFMK